MAKSPLVDLTSINGAESLFQNGPRDPFAQKLAAELADLFVFNENVRFAYTRPFSTSHDAEYGKLPPLLDDLIRRDPAVFSEESIPADPKMDEENLVPMFESFRIFAESNRRSIKEFVALHNQPHIKIRKQFKADVNPGFVFPVHSLASRVEFKELAARVGISEEDLCHVFDMRLKYTLYGAYANDGALYLAHPLRIDKNFPGATHKRASSALYPFRIGQEIIKIGKTLSRDEYTRLLHEARGFVQDWKLHDAKPDEVSDEVKRELAIKLGLRPHLKDATSALESLRTAAEIASLFPTVALIAAPVSVLIGGLSRYWKSPLPRYLSTWTWLHPFVEWDIETQNKNAQPELGDSG